MRSPEEIKKLIIDFARSDERIRAVLLNGSRANSKISPDEYQDYDIVYVVDNIESFISDKGWTNVFGDKLIWQFPDEMVVGNEESDRASQFSLLMIFTDANRIDLTLLSKTGIDINNKPDSLTIVWLDKDDMFSNIDLPNDSDHLVKQPTEKEFLDTCNEFWWVCTYVAKGLVRNELTYSKAMLETVVRPMFMNVVAWYIGVETDFSVSAGKAGRFMKSLLPAGLYDDILRTYSDHIIENNWQAMFLMMDIFGKLSRYVSRKLKFKYVASEEENVIAYLDQLYKEKVSDKV